MLNSVVYENELTISHRGGAGYREFGKRYAEVMLPLLGYKLSKPDSQPAPQSGQP